jgi:SAM-dependent methyltransferase
MIQGMPRRTTTHTPTPFPVTAREQQLILLKRRVVTQARRVVSTAVTRAAALRAGGSAGAGRPGSSAAATPSAGPQPPGSAAAPAPAAVAITEFSYYRGVLHVEGSLTSDEPVAGVGVITGAAPYRRAAAVRHTSGSPVPFQFDASIGSHQAAGETVLAVEYRSGRVHALNDIAGRALADDPVPALTRTFHEAVSAMPQPRVLEVGARARSGNVYRSWLPGGATYVGCDILPGDNVDVVGDAHRLSEFLPPNSFDALYSVSTMEHLAMPWLAAVEMNRVLKPGGVMFHATHQTWPVHDAPWDFYRFSEFSWVTLFNRFSGFEILGTAAGEPGKVVANVLHPATNGLELQPAFLSSAVLVRKVGETDLHWAADAAAVVRDAYPA